MKLLKSNIIDVDAHPSVTVIEPSNLYGCKLSEDVFIGPFVEIQKRVSVGKRTKIQSHSFIFGVYVINIIDLLQTPSHTYLLKIYLSSPFTHITLLPSYLIANTLQAQTIV